MKTEPLPCLFYPSALILGPRPVIQTGWGQVIRIAPVLAESITFWAEVRPQVARAMVIRIINTVRYKRP